MKKNILISIIVILTSIFNLSFSEFVEPEMIIVPNGSFIMGNNNSAYDDEKPEHSVTLSNDYKLSKYNVTTSEFCEMLNYALAENLLAGDFQNNIAVKNSNGIQKILLDMEDPPADDCEIYFDPSENIFKVDEGKDNRPIIEISWYGSVFYCNMLSKKYGLTELYNLNTWRCNDIYGVDGYRLPTEAEWEYAARYNDGRTYAWGNQTPDTTLANISWYYDHTFDVGKYSPQGDSELGFSDITGNVFDWINDYYNNSYYSVSPAINPEGASSPSYSGNSHSLRGSSFHSMANSDWLYLSKRTVNNPDATTYATSFRVQRTVQENGIEDNYELAITNYELKQNYPNPFNPVTKISYQLAVSSEQLVEIIVYNSAGQKIWSSPITDHSLRVTGSVLFNGSNLNSGIYYYSLVINGKEMDTKSMVLIK